MIERIVPDTVVVATARDDLEVELHPSERSALGNAVEKRRREFVTGRACAHRALERLGAPAAAVPSGARGEPVWPAGVAGSITHCSGYRAAAVAHQTEVLSIGIDAEVDGPLPAGVREQVAFGAELDAIERGAPGAHLDRVLFSAKEAVYKAWYPLARRWLGFEDVELDIDVERNEFAARLLVRGPLVGAGVRLTELRGRWTAEAGIVAAAVVIAR